MSTQSKAELAITILKKQGFTWFPNAKQWIKSPGLPLEEVRSSPGWYRCGHLKATCNVLVSWDGYSLVTKEHDLIHFDLSLRERRWSPSIGYEERVCFVPTDIQEDLAQTAASNLGS